MPTVLLVDDEPLQAFDRKSALERRFHGIERVTDAAAALCLVEQSRFADNLSLVITGHHSAGFGGPAFVSELLARLPALKVIVIGNSGESASDYAASEVCFLPREIAPDQLAAFAAQVMKECERTAA